ncbi:cytochrome b-c1 complex subunit 10-like [Cyprinus carpio]|uniref:Cytochrome b-c1 complex subunit 10-like n=2 Tax=Cyprinus carpio TaxID=7962 RepID=A0A9Q9W2F7_CYPCA|nr:cytochrome b-c1 complex subunit 10-like [Cyprinus carpio]
MLGNIIGQKYVSIAKSCYSRRALSGCSAGLLKSVVLAVWGGAGGLALVHFTDWRLILDFVPYINGKFKTED